MKLVDGKSGSSLTIRGRGGEILKNYAKIILYAYPLLKTVGKDYEDHVKNKAVLSYTGRETAESLAEYLAEEILRMRRLEWLKGKVEEILKGLSEVERTLIAVRYFGKPKGIKKLFTSGLENPLKGKPCTRRTYFRRQQRLGEKIAAAFVAAGLTEETYEREFAKIELFAKIAKGVEEGRDKKISVNERRWIDG